MTALSSALIIVGTFCMAMGSSTFRGWVLTLVLGFLRWIGKNTRVWRRWLRVRRAWVRELFRMPPRTRSPNEIEVVLSDETTVKTEVGQPAKAPDLGLRVSWLGRSLASQIKRSAAAQAEERRLRVLDARWIGSGLVLTVAGVLLAWLV